MLNELLKAQAASASALTVNGKTIGENVPSARRCRTRDVIQPYDKPMKQQAGFLVLKGNLFDSAIMKTSVISDEFRERYLSESDGPERVRGPRRRVRRTGGLSPPHRRSVARRSTSTRILFMRGVGPIGYPGSAEVVNMQPPAALIKQGITPLPCIGDGRQSGTSGSPSILNASPEAAAGGGLALLADRRPRAHRPEQRHRQHPDLEGGTGAAPRAALAKARRLHYPASQTPWQEIQRAMVDQTGGRHGAEAGREIPARRADPSVPRDNHWRTDFSAAKDPPAMSRPIYAAHLYRLTYRPASAGCLLPK